MAKVVIIQGGESTTKEVGADHLDGEAKRPTVTISKKNGQPMASFVDSQTEGDSNPDPAPAAVPIPPSRRASKQAR
jgi:hypothetical protein